MANKDSPEFEAPAAGFWNYPPPKQGPEVPYKNDASPNPVLRGTPLAIAGSLIRSSSSIQSILWKNAKFDTLCDVSGLADYEARFDPSVIPFDSAPSPPTVKSIAELPRPFARQNDKLHYTIGDFHEAYTSGRTTPTAVIEVLLPLIRKKGKHAVAFLEIKEDIVKRKAEEATQRFRDGNSKGILDGVPVAVKDEVFMEGYRRWWGTKVDVTRGKGDKKTAWCIEKLEEAGAIIIGKTNMHECGLDTTNNNPNHGTPLNPHNPSYYCGGSSGGSAYSAAAGLCPFVVGVDGGGSIRIPASFCGLYGIKPTHGRISARPTPDMSVCVDGPLASNIDDLALVYRIMAQPDPHHRTSSRFPKSFRTGPPQRPDSAPKYLGICPEWLARMDPSVRTLFDAAVHHFTTTLNYRRVEIKIPYLPQSQKAHAVTILSEARSFFNTLQPLALTDLSPPCQLLLSVTGTHATAQTLLSAQKLRDLLMRHFAHLWQQYPGMLVLTPTTPLPGSRIDRPGDIAVGKHGVSDGDRSLKSMEYAFMANFMGAPAISVPMGYVKGEKNGKKGEEGEGEADVPIGLMAMGRWGAEEDLLEFGRDSVRLLDGVGGVRRPRREGAWVDVLGLAVGGDGKGKEEMEKEKAASAKAGNAEEIGGEATQQQQQQQQQTEVNGTEPTGVTQAEEGHEPDTTTTVAADGTTKTNKNEEAEVKRNKLRKRSTATLKEKEREREREKEANGTA
ncbi:MAG: hypothetical protein Q9227_000452 [Pyrenula ochraceoflavens]